MSCLFKRLPFLSSASPRQWGAHPACAFSMHFPGETPILLRYTDDNVFYVFCCCLSFSPTCPGVSPPNVGVCKYTVFFQNAASDSRRREPTANDRTRPTSPGQNGTRECVLSLRHGGKNSATETRPNVSPQSLFHFRLQIIITYWLLWVQSSAGRVSFPIKSQL